MATKQTPEEKLVTAACKAIEKDGWTDLNLADVARKAKIPLSTVYDICPTKAALLPLIGKDIDLRFLENVPEIDETMHVRDRAFDAILSWFEQVQPLKPVFAAIRNDSRGDLSLIVDLVPMAMRSAHWMPVSIRRFGSCGMTRLGGSQRRRTRRWHSPGSPTSPRSITTTPRTCSTW